MNPVLKGSFDICAGALLLIVVAVAGPSFAQSVTTYHGGLERTGNFVVPALTWDRARRVHLDRSFAPRFSGHVYSQPLYWQPGAATGQLIVATESNTV